MIRTPIALKHDTIYECVFELRFAAGNQSLTELLPGMLFKAFPDTFQKLVPLPIAQFPKAMRDSTPELTYQPLKALEGNEFRLVIGDRSAGLAFPRPYSSWSNVKPKIIESVLALIDTKMMGEVERFSLKYTNVVDTSDPSDLSQLNLKVSFGELSPNPEGIAIKAEFPFGGCVNIVQVATGVTVKVQTPKLTADVKGLLVDVDTIRMGPFPDFQQTFSDLLDQTHDAAKQVFFGLLTPSCIEKLGPIWAQS